jgi:hypothetical protein
MYSLTVTVIKAQNLKAADKGGTSDPYVKLYIKSKDTKSFKTNKIMKTLNPVWNETFAFKDVVVDDTLIIKCYDWDKVGKDDPLGSLTISIKSLMEKILNGVEADWWSLEKATSGSINLSFSFDPRPKRDVLAVSPRQSNPKLTVPRSSTGDSITSVKSPRSSKNLDPDQVNAINFNVIISNCRCRNLKAMDSNGLSDPFITFNFDGVEFETEIKEKTLNPVFDFRKEFKYTLRAKEIDIMHKKLVKITVTDYDRTSRNDIIDTVTLNLEQLATGPIHHCHTLTHDGEFAGVLYFDIMVAQDNGDKFVQLPEGSFIDYVVVQPRPILSRSTTQIPNKVVTMSAYIGQQEETMNALLEGLKELKEDEVITKQTLHSLVSFKCICTDISPIAEVFRHYLELKNEEVVGACLDVINGSLANSDAATRCIDSGIFNDVCELIKNWSTLHLDASASQVLCAVILAAKAARQEISNLEVVVHLLGKLLDQGVNIERVATALGSFHKIKKAVEVIQELEVDKSLYGAAMSNVHSGPISMAIVKTLQAWAANDDKSLDFDRFSAYFLALLQLSASTQLSAELFKLLNVLSGANKLSNMSPIIHEVDKQFAALFVDSSNSSQIIEVLKLLASSSIGLEGDVPSKLVVLLTMAREREAKIADLDAKIKDAEREKRTDLVETYKSALSLIDKDSGSMYDSLATLLSTAIQKDDTVRALLSDMIRPEDRSFMTKLAERISPLFAGYTYNISFNEKIFLGQMLLCVTLKNLSESTDIAAKCFMHIQNILKRVDQRNIAAETDLTRVQCVIEATVDTIKRTNLPASVLNPALGAFTSLVKLWPFRKMSAKLFGVTEDALMVQLKVHLQMTPIPFDVLVDILRALFHLTKDENASIKVALFDGAFPLLLSVLKLSEKTNYIKLAKHTLGIFAAICSTHAGNASRIVSDNMALFYILRNLSTEKKYPSKYADNLLNLLIIFAKDPKIKLLLLEEQVVNLLARLIQQFKSDKKIFTKVVTFLTLLGASQ